MVIFEGEPSGSPGKNGMTSAIEIVTLKLEIPWGSLDFFTFNTATVRGHTHNGMYKKITWNI